ncbi:MAG TPA: Gfo/Idh/MocA family oxidoreductase [Thermomicrobiales bacterium]|nr:Gfo/Idh/MocA family oxidoreductase [Thermomicrobiales bacterium]
MASSRNVRVGLAGLGNFGRLHARILSQLGSVDLAAVCDPDSDARTWAAETLGATTTVGDFDDLLRVPELDALFIVTPEDLHYGHVLKALTLGIPIFMEKPLSTNAADARRVVDAARAAGTFLQIGFVVRFDAQHAMLRNRIVAGELGSIVLFRAKRNCSRSWFATYGDRAHTVYESIIHDIDLALWFTQCRCTKVYAVQRNISGLTYPDALAAMLQLENGSVVMLDTSWFVPDQAPQNVIAGDWTGTIDAEFELIGTEQTARYRLLDSGMSIATPDQIIHPEVGLWPEVYGSIGGALRLEDEHFISCVRSGRPSTIASLDDALHGLEIAEAIVHSAESGLEVTL